MSGPATPVGEDDLHAYVDNRLDPARREVVARHLAANPALAQRVADWASQATALRQAMIRDDAARSPDILARLARPRQAAPRWAVAAALVLALGLGGATGWLVHGDARPTEIARLGTEAASAYRVFANDPARAVEVSSEDPVALRSWITQKLGRRVALPDLGAMGYRLLGGRVLSAMYGPAAMLVYQDATGNRITVYVQPMAVGIPARMRPVETQSVSGYAWIDRQIGYTVLSEQDRTHLHSVADQVRADTDA